VTNARPVLGSEYIHWAKTYGHVRFDLATSSVTPCSIEQFPFSIADIEIDARGAYGYPPLIHSLASMLNVEPNCIVQANGTSMANHLAMASLIQPGDEILMERPAYEPLLMLAHYLRATVQRFDRRADEDFRVDIREIERAVSSRTRLIVLTNLHNPTSTFVDTETLAKIGDIAKGVGARVLVDEVYLPAMFDQPQKSAFHLGSQFVTTGSLTKAYGLSGLRCGWILAEPRLAEQMWRLNDLFGVLPPRAIEKLSVIALKHLRTIADRARTLIEKNRPILHAFFDSRNDLECPRREFGTVAFPRLLLGNVDALWDFLVEKYDTAFVPGRFFEKPDHFRIGIGCDTEVLKEGLARLAMALDEQQAWR
jgi:aspartate/methionine/tyrosine aminotransferase